MRRGQEREEDTMALRIFSTKYKRLVWCREEEGEREWEEREGERGKIVGGKRRREIGREREGRENR